MKMNEVIKKFVRYAMLSVFALLTVLLSIINGINFTMAGEDADRITKRLSERNGVFSVEQKFDDGESFKSESSDQADYQNSFFQNDDSKRMGPMGPDSPEVNDSVRFFTYSFDKKGNAEKIAFHISAIDEKEAEEWAKSLMNEKIGWTKGTYRYRVYKHNKKTYVTVIDQGRELLPSYRILIISVFGEVIGLAVSFIILRIVGRRLFRPLEEADRKQKQFIANIESDFKMPLTVINANTELIEKENGSSDYIRSINRQVRKMTSLVKEIGSLAIFEEKDMTITKVNLSSTLSSVLDYKKASFEEEGIQLNLSIEDNLIIDGEEEKIKKLLSEIAENAVKYSLTKADFTLKKEKDRILLIQTNDTDLPTENIEQIFDRFTVLSNAENTAAIGLGLAYAKDIVTAHNGRITARVSDGVFTLEVSL